VRRKGDGHRGADAERALDLETSAVQTIGEFDSVFVMHNDAVVQGLCEAPFMRDIDRWGVMTLGTGLGNARFTAARNGKARKAA
jgi:hypothetical protein